jgi:glycosyltransferase involved in cell wall biosynthesis
LGHSATGRAAGNFTGRLNLLRQLLFTSPGVRAYVASLRKLLQQLNPDVIHTNGFKMHLLGALAKPAATPLVWHVHDYVQARPFMARLMKRYHKRCTIALANSNSVALDLKAACGNTLPVQTFYNAIDTDVFSPDGERLDLDSLSGLPPADPLRPNLIRVGMIATFARWKGHEVFLGALALLPSELNWRGYIVGDALYQTEGSQFSLAELRGVAEGLGLSDRVGFTGFVDQPAAAMRALDIVVHASTEPEPFGLVIVEGMACGRAVIASDAGGAAELFETGVNALGHTPGDAAQLAERITKLATDSDLRKRLGAAARSNVEQRFNRARLAEELIPIYAAAIPKEHNSPAV